MQGFKHPTRQNVKHHQTPFA
uniref:Uncharacterized protein n=1 Tax=Arundo donax TaxID=35708 RepID=A0A0A9C737_ARUDO